VKDGVAAGLSESDAKAKADAWVKEQEAAFKARYELELMNPKEALSLGSISEIVMPRELRKNLIKSLNFYISTYKVGPMQSVQRESF
jgi:acetyl-CoA carboxylase carboxyltransferase component